MKKTIFWLMIIGLICANCGTPKNFIGKCRPCSETFDKDVLCGEFMSSQTAYAVAERKGGWVECY